MTLTPPERSSRTLNAAPLQALLIAIALVPWAAPAAERSSRTTEPEDLPTIAAKTAGMEKRSGLFDFYVDQRRGTVWLEIPAPAGDRGAAAELLYVHGLAQGLGSNPIGLDRGQLAAAKVLEVRRLGPRVLFEQPNLGFRATSTNPDERRAVRESFASSVVWGAEIAALDPDGRSLVDLASFLVRDAHGVETTLRSRDQGAYELDPERSAVDLAGCLAFPDNLELEVVLTYAAEDEPGQHVAATVPTPDSVTLVGRHSLIRLPDDGFRPRAFDPRLGSFAVAFADYAASLDEPLEQRLVARHRLVKTDPEAERSTVVEPIVYYVDPAAPEPVRSALVEGASWWAEAFEKAGFVDAYRVEVLPDDIHPLDVRYNVIQWVHRSTRGWSYGGGVIDPRTGEFVKGHVSLGSLRVRQDRLLFEGLAGTANTGSDAADDPVQLALARLRQLSAHEVGHTLGFAHNFAASTYDGRASVMDYPAPMVGVTPDGELDFSGAYGKGVGAWDVQCVRYAYSEFPPGSDEQTQLQNIVDATLRDHVFVADRHARPAAASDPRGNLWDNGDDAVAALAKTLQVRQIALACFGEDNVRLGQPLATLQEVLAPLYFHHRYQLDAAVKTVGGMEISYAVRGDHQLPTRIVGGDRQRQALRVILGILSPEVLDLPEPVLQLLGPRPPEWPPNREIFASTTWPAFDPLGAAATATDQVVQALLLPQRLGRVYDFNRRDPQLPGVGEVLGNLLDAAFATSTNEPPRHLALRHTIRRVVVDRLMTTTAPDDLRPDLRAELERALREALARLDAMSDGTQEAALAGDIRRFLDRDLSTPPSIVPPPDPPPGSPIGSGHLAGCGWAGDPVASNQWPVASGQ